MNVDYLVYQNCKILDSNFYLRGDMIAINANDLNNFQDNTRVFFNYIRYFSGSKENVTISFTEDKWNIITYETNQVSKETQKIEANVSYSIANRVYMIINGDKLFLNVDNQMTAKLKSIEISINKNNLTVLSTGNWVEPLVGPLYVYCSKMDQLNIEALNETWFKFNVDPPVIDTPSESNNIDDSDVTLPETSSNNIDDSDVPLPETSSNNIDDSDVTLPETSSSNIEPIIPTKVPTSKKEYYIIVGDDNSYCSQFKQYISDCSSNPNSDSDCADFLNIAGVVCSNGQNINNEIGNIDQSSQALFIQTFKNIPDIDFNQLKKAIPVEIMSIPPDFGDEEEDKSYQSKFLIHNSQRKPKKMSMNKKNIKDDNSIFTVGIRGNIRTKVPTLCLQYLSLEVKNEPLNIINLQFIDSIINENSNLIQVNHLVVSEFAHQMILENSRSKIKVGQYSIAYSAYNILDYRISFGQEQWNILSGSNNNYSPIFDEENINYVPYSFCDRLSLIAVSHHFNFHVENSGITNAKAVNLTLIELSDFQSAKLLDDGLFDVKLSTSGNWDGIKNPVSVFFTADQNYVNLDSKDCNSKVNIEKFDFSNLPIGDPPVEINDTTKKDNIEVGVVDITENKTVENIKNTIETIFEASSKNETLDQNADQIVTIVSKKDEEIEFKDLTLKENQYIKVDNDASLKLTSGQLNLVLDNTTSAVKVKVENNEDVKLSIKNMDECTIKLDADRGENEETKSISIKSNSEVYGPLKFDVTENVKKIEIASINLHDAGSVSSNVPVTVEKLSAQPQTTGKLTNLTVSSVFNISQSAVLELDDVNLAKAEISLNLHTYTSSNYETPILNGTLGEPPLKIDLVKPGNDDTSAPVENVKFLLFRGTFKTSCNAWIEKISFDKTDFNQGVCDDIEASKLLEEDKSLNVMKSKGVDKDNENDDKKLTGGQIAGIAIGCVLGVAIIVGVVVFFVLKKKKDQQSSGAESNDEGQEVDL